MTRASSFVDGFSRGMGLYMGYQDWQDRKANREEEKAWRDEQREWQRQDQAYKGQERFDQRSVRRLNGMINQWRNGTAEEQAAMAKVYKNSVNTHIGEYFNQTNYPLPEGGYVEFTGWRQADKGPGLLAMVDIKDKDGKVIKSDAISRYRSDRKDDPYVVFKETAPAEMLIRTPGGMSILNQMEQEMLLRGGQLQDRVEDLYRGKDGQLTTTPNGDPVAQRSRLTGAVRGLNIKAPEATYSDVYMNSGGDFVDDPSKGYFVGQRNDRNNRFHGASTGKAKGSASGLAGGRYGDLGISKDLEKRAEVWAQGQVDLEMADMALLPEEERLQKQRIYNKTERVRQLKDQYLYSMVAPAGGGAAGGRRGNTSDVLKTVLGTETPESNTAATPAPDQGGKKTAGRYPSFDEVKKQNNPNMTADVMASVLGNPTMQERQQQEDAERARKIRSLIFSETMTHR